MRRISGVFAGALILCSVAVAVIAACQSRRAPAHSLPAAAGWSAREDHEWSEAHARESNRLQALLDDGIDAVNEGRLADGEAKFREATQGRFGRPEAWLRLADAYEREGRVADALKSYESLMSPSGWSSLASEPAAHMRYALALARAGRWSDAANQYDAAMAPPQADQRELMRGLPSKAAGLDRDSLLAAAHVGAASGDKWTSWDWPDHMRAALALKPHWGPLRLVYAKSLLRQGRRAEAQQQFEQAAADGDPATAKEAAEQAKRLLTGGMTLQQRIEEVQRLVKTPRPPKHQ